MHCFLGRQPPERQCIHKYPQGNEERATSNARGLKSASKPPYPLSAPSGILWGKSRPLCNSAGKGSGQPTRPALLQKVFCWDLLLPLQRAAGKIMSSSAAGRALRANSRWKRDREEQRAAAAEGPWPEGRTPHVQTVIPRALRRFWQQEMQNVYGKNGKNKNLSWALTIMPIPT